MAKECSCSDELSDQPCPSHGELFSPTDEEADALGLPRIPKQVWFSIGGADISLGSIKAALGLAGLYVITGADKAVLDGMCNANKFSLLALSELPMGVAYASVGLAAQAELDRRKGLK